MLVDDLVQRGNGEARELPMQLVIGLPFRTPRRNLSPCRMNGIADGHVRQLRTATRAHVSERLAQRAGLWLRDREPGGELID